MNKQLLNRFLIFLGCAALLSIAFTHPLHSTDEVMCKGADQMPKQEVPGSQLLWESLSHQFLSSVKY